MVNRAWGEFTIISPATPDARIVKTSFAEPNHRKAPLVTADDEGIWYLLAGPSHNNRDLVRLAPDGGIVSRTTIALPPGIKPLRLAISGRDVYIAGVGATVYRYELPQFE